MNAVVASGVPRATNASPVRHRLARLHKGARSTRRRRARRLARPDRRGVALQADVAAARSARRGSSPRAGVRARPPRRSADRGPRERAAAWRRPGRVPGIELDPAQVETNIVVFAYRAPAALCAALEREGVSWAPSGRAPCAPSPTSTLTARTSTRRSPSCGAPSIKQTERSGGTVGGAPPSSLGAQRPGDDRPRRRGALSSSGAIPPAWRGGSTGAMNDTEESPSTVHSPLPPSRRL